MPVMPISVSARRTLSRRCGWTMAVTSFMRRAPSAVVSGTLTIDVITGLAMGGKIQPLGFVLAIHAQAHQHVGDFGNDIGGDGREDDHRYDADELGSELLRYRMIEAAPA